LLCIVWLCLIAVVSVFVGFFVGFIMTLSNVGFMAAMLAFFIAGSKVTKWRSSHKRKFEADFKEGCH